VNFSEKVVLIKDEANKITIVMLPRIEELRLKKVWRRKQQDAVAESSEKSTKSQTISQSPKVFFLELACLTARQ